MIGSRSVLVLTVALSVLCYGYPEYRASARTVQFSVGFSRGLIDTDQISDASGLGASRLHPGNFYTHNDRHGDAKLYVINGTGHLQARLYLQGVTDFDWEDLSVGPCGRGSNKSCIYLDPDGNVLVVSKEKHAHGHVAFLDPLAWGTGKRVDVTSTAKVNIDSAHPGPQGGDISRDGTEIIIKTKDVVYYWNTMGSRDYFEVLSHPGLQLPYARTEPQGEAICWGPDGQDYFTLSEGLHQPLYHYARA